jgi:LacI family transcriptional regulator
MAHPYLIKDIAFQAGLSTATVDRVINARGTVRRQTILRVEAAIEELKRQEQATIHAGRIYVFDVVMEAPNRFSTAVKSAFEAEVAAFLPIAIRLRFHCAEQMRDSEMLQILDRIGKRGSHGVILKAPDTTAMRTAIGSLHDAGIPVITLVTDLPQSKRIAYAGADNRAAGATAAYLIGSILGQTPPKVLVTLSSNLFQGEEQRETGFRAFLAARYPGISVVSISEGFGKDRATGLLVGEALKQEPDIRAVYSIGGGNMAVIDAFAAETRAIACFVAHDLDNDNIALLNEEKIHFVLHHDLRSDASSVFRTFLKSRYGARLMAGPALSQLAIITPFNVPS